MNGDNEINRYGDSLRIVDSDGDHLRAYPSISGRSFVVRTKGLVALGQEAAEVLRDALTEWLDRPAQAEPGAGARVEDRDGETWVLQDRRWWCIGGPPGVSHEWADLVRVFGPVTIHYPDGQ